MCALRFGPSWRLSVAPPVAGSKTLTSAGSFLLAYTIGSMTLSPVLVTKETRLEKSRTSSVYRRRLSSCFSVFLHWVNSFATSLSWDLSPSSADEALARFVQYCHDSSRPIWIARHAILGAQTFYRGLKGQLTRSWNAIRSWQFETPLASRVPLPLEVLHAMFASALSLASSYPHAAHLLISFAVLIRVGFFALLRPGELLKLRVGDILFPSVMEGAGIAVLAIRDAKNRLYMGRYQFATLKDFPTVQWLRWLCKHLPSTCKLWPSSGVKFRNIFNWVVSSLDLQRFRFSPAGLRSGGTTHCFLSGVSVDNLKFAGRWATERTLNVYIQEAMAQLIWISLTEDERQMLQYIWIKTDIQWQTPPNTTWLAFFSRRRCRGTTKTVQLQSAWRL